MTPEQYELAAIDAMVTQWGNVGPDDAGIVFPQLRAEEQPAPDLEYTPIADKLPELVRAEEVAALRARVAELERQLDAVPVEAILRYLDHMWACSYPGSMRDMKAMAAWADGERAKQQEAQP